jgi:hypothetical protein
MGILITELFSDLPDEINFLPACAVEVSKIIQDSGIEDDFADSFEIRIDLLAKYKKKCVGLCTKKFRKVQDYENLYEMKFKLKINIRIIFTFINDHVVFLLCGFCEKKGNCDYDRALKLSLKRSKLLKRG